MEHQINYLLQKMLIIFLPVDEAIQKWSQIY